MSEIGAGGSASLAIGRCAISSLGLSRNSTVADFRFHSRKTGQFITTTITVELVSSIERVEKHKSPSTIRRDAARAAVPAAARIQQGCASGSTSGLITESGS